MSPRLSRILHRAKRLLCPPGELVSNNDRLLLRWLGISLIALAIVTVLSLAGLMEEVELEQIRVLAGSPFYMTGEEAQVNLMGPGGTFALSLFTALALTLVLLRERRFVGRLQIFIPALVVLALPGLLCVLWGGVLNMSMPVLTAILCYVGCELRPIERALRHRYFPR